MLLLRRFLTTGFTLSGCLLASQALADTSTNAMNAFPQTPGISLDGMAGNGWFGMGDVMLPLVGQSTSFTYVDPQFYYYNDNNSQYTGSAGIGQRWLNADYGILGAYVFGDYNHSAPNGSNFWFISPGIERLGKVFDLSVNGYIPVSSQRVNTGTVFSDQVGDFSNVTFSGHNQFDTLSNTYDATGPGFDAEVGMRLPVLHNTRVFVGGYYFAPKDTNNIGGGAVRAEVPVNNYLALTVSESYDNEYHNTIKGGITLRFGGRSTGYKFNGDLAERMVDPIRRNLIITSGGSHTGQPVVSESENTGQTALELSNISFFVPGAPTMDSMAVEGNGTYENPYQGMTQDNVDNANAQNNRNFYINSGTYTAVYGTQNLILLNNDQLYGRQNYFTAPAEGAARPLIDFSQSGFYVPASDTSDSFNNIRLQGPADLTNTAGIFVDHSNASNNTYVSADNISIEGFNQGFLAASQFSPSLLDISIQNSTFTNNSFYGVRLFNVTNVTTGTSLLHATINNSVMSNNEENGLSIETNAAGGASAQSNVNVSNSIFEDNGRGIAIQTRTSSSGGDTEAFVNIYNCIVANNEIGIGIGNIATALTAQSNTDTIVNIWHSYIANNSIIGVQASSLANVNTTGSSTANLGLNIFDTTIAQNAIGIATSSQASEIAFSSGSVASTVNINVLNSSIIDNGIGVEANQQAFIPIGAPGTSDANVYVNIDHSIVAGNAVAIDTFGGNIGDGAGGATVIVRNPVFFDGIVNYAGGSTVIFPNGTPTSGSNVHCVFGICTFNP